MSLSFLGVKAVLLWIMNARALPQTHNLLEVVFRHCIFKSFQYTAAVFLDDFWFGFASVCFFRVISESTAMRAKK